MQQQQQIIITTVINSAITRARTTGITTQAKQNKLLEGLAAVESKRITEKNIVVMVGFQKAQ